MAAATAESNAKIGISNVLPSGNDYNWVCVCQGFAGQGNDTQYTPPPAGVVNTVKGNCPVDVALGCYDLQTNTWR